MTVEAELTMKLADSDSLGELEAGRVIRCIFEIELSWMPIMAIMVLVSVREFIEDNFICALHQEQCVLWSPSLPKTIHHGFQSMA